MPGPVRFAFLSIMAILAGCGGKEVVQGPDANAPPQQVAAPAPVVARAVAPANPMAAAPAVPAATTRPQTIEPEEDDEPGRLPPGVVLFETVTDPEPVFELVPPGQAAVPDLFAVNPPPAGTNSATFALVTATAAGTAAPTRPATAGAGTSGVTLPDGFTPLPEFGFADDGSPLRIRCDKDEAEMVYIPAGVARMGVENGPPEASPVIAVPLDAFYIDVTETTVGRYQAFRDDRRDSKKVVRPEPINASDPPDFAVRGITWGDARFYAQWAGKELPTEAQWEMAARGPNGFEHPWGNGRAVWPGPRTPDELHPVMSFRTDQSPFGVFDMAGNVREWTLDAFSPTAFRDVANAPTGQLKNWEGPRRGAVENTHVVKGNGPGWTVWQRGGVSIRERPADVGFRCVLRLKPDDAKAGTGSRPGTPKKVN